MIKFFIALSFCLLSACAKDVKKESPMGNDVLPGAGNTQEYSFHTLAVFANHAALDKSFNLYSEYQVSEHVEILIPKSITSISFSNTRPTLILTLNGSVVCQYSWVLNKYQAASSCAESLELRPNDALSLVNLPKGQTGSVYIYYKKIN